MLAPSHCMPHRFSGQPLAGDHLTCVGIQSSDIEDNHGYQTVDPLKQRDGSACRGRTSA